jgi:hypothetical protein
VTAPSANGSENGRSVWDLGEAAAAAAAAEAEAVPFTFAYKGRSYEVPPMAEWPVAALRAIAQGDLDAALGTLLGEKTYDGLCAAGLNVGQLNQLFDRLSKESGLGGTPNSPPPRRRASTRK